MSATNTTTNLGLSQFVNTDVPAWRQDYNGDMLKIDNAYTADISGATAETSADPSDYMKFYDVSATTNKKILISDLLKGAKVEDLTDTDITTPTDDDGLVYDATAQKWENKQITTKEQWKKNGAYNLCPNNATSQVINAVTFTVKSDGSISANGTASGDITFSLAENIHLSKSKYVLVGGNNASQFLYLGYADGSWHPITQTDSSGFANFEISAGRNDFVVGLFISSGQVVDFEFRPMITTDLNATYADYVPHAMTNRELTDGLSAKADNYIYDASTDSYIFTIKTVNNTAQGYVGVSQMKFSPSLGKIFFYALDGTYMGETTYTPAT